VDAKRRAAAEAVRLADVRADEAREAASAEAAAAAVRAAAAGKAAQKAAALQLAVEVATWRRAVDLHARAGIAWQAKQAAVARLHAPAAGGFKLVGGELRWRDADAALGWLAPHDPRHFKDAHPLLKRLLTPGSVKPWVWRESLRPPPPEGMPTTTTGDDDAATTELPVDEGGGEAENDGASPLTERRPKQQWARNQAY
jgi:hypothetical protein